MTIWEIFTLAVVIVDLNLKRAVLDKDVFSPKAFATCPASLAPRAILPAGPVDLMCCIKSGSPVMVTVAPLVAPVVEALY